MVKVLEVIDNVIHVSAKIDGDKVSVEILYMNGDRVERKSLTVNELVLSDTTVGFKNGKLEAPYGMVELKQSFSHVHHDFVEYRFKDLIFKVRGVIEFPRHRKSSKCEVVEDGNILRLVCYHYIDY